MTVVAIAVITETVVAGREVGPLVATVVVWAITLESGVRRDAKQSILYTYILIQGDGNFASAKLAAVQFFDGTVSVITREILQDSGSMVSDDTY